MALNGPVGSGAAEPLINNFIDRFAMNLLQENSTITHRHFLLSRPGVNLECLAFTVNLALSRLHAEGYLQSKIDSGTFISEALPETVFSARITTAAPPSERPSWLLNRVKDIPDHRAGKQFDFGIAGPPGVSFVPAVAALDEFPIDVWERLRTEVLSQKGAHLLQYASSRGDPELRKALTTYLCDYRGARRSRSNHHYSRNAAGNDDQRDGTGKSRRGGMDSGPGVSRPGERSASPARRSCQDLLTGKESQSLGHRKSSSPKIIYVTPSHRFPLGITMSLSRRTALIDFARTCDAYIFEDDHNSEFRTPVPHSRVYKAWIMSVVSSTQAR